MLPDENVNNKNTYVVYIYNIYTCNIMCVIYDGMIYYTPFFPGASNVDVYVHTHAVQYSNIATTTTNI